MWSQRGRSPFPIPLHYCLGGFNQAPSMGRTELTNLWHSGHPKVPISRSLTTDTLLFVKACLSELVNWTSFLTPTNLPLDNLLTRQDQIVSFPKVSPRTRRKSFSRVSRLYGVGVTRLVLPIITNKIKSNLTSWSPANISFAGRKGPH